MTTPALLVALAESPPRISLVEATFNPSLNRVMIRSNVGKVENSRASMVYMDTIRIRTEKQILTEIKTDNRPDGTGTIMMIMSATTLREIIIPVNLVVFSIGVAATAVALANNFVPPKPRQIRHSDHQKDR
jgi:hypothetical protein